jgi:hypothetical protein
MAKTSRQSRPAHGSLKFMTQALSGGLSQKQFDDVLEELKSQTDRGAAVVGTSFLEWRVKNSIKMRLPHWDSQGDGLFGKELKNGALAFLDQCKMAYCLGLVGEAGFRDLERVAQIRNRFAHNLTVTSFVGDDAVAQRCKDLENVSGVLGSWDKCRASDSKPLTKAETNKRLRERFELTVRHAFLGLFAVVNMYDVAWPKVDKKLLLFW